MMPQLGRQRALHPLRSIYIPMKSGEVYELLVDLGPCAATIQKGHQLRVDICGSLFPLHDRNEAEDGLFRR